MFESVAATVEATPLPDNVIDLVVAGQAFHRFDRPRTKVESRRIANGPSILERQVCQSDADFAKLAEGNLTAAVNECVQSAEQIVIRNCFLVLGSLVWRTPLKERPFKTSESSRTFQSRDS